MSTHLRPEVRTQPDRDVRALAHAVTAAQAVLVGCGGVLLILGVIIWSGRADELIPIHILVGIVLVLALWTIAAIAARSGVANSLVAGAVAWSIVAPILGATQEAFLVGRWHWVVQLLHLVVAMGVVAWGRALVVLTRRADSDGR